MGSADEGSRPAKEQGEILNETSQVRIHKLLANVVSSVVVILLSGAAVLLVRQLPGHRPTDPWHIGALLAGIVALSVVHETLHAFALMSAARLRPSSFRFGIVWEALMPFCHCLQPVRLAHYRFMTLLPLVVTGLLSVALMVEYPSDAMAAFAGITLGVCTGDVWMCWRLRRFSGDCLALDHPEEIGCDVLPCRQPAR